MKVMSENDIVKRIQKIFNEKMGYMMGIREICKSSEKYRTEMLQNNQ